VIQRGSSELAGPKATGAGRKIGVSKRLLIAARAEIIQRDRVRSIALPRGCRQLPQPRHARSHASAPGSPQEITERVGASTDPADAARLSEELGALTIDMATLGYQRRSNYEEPASLQLACDGAREAITGLRARRTATAAAELTVEGAQTATAPGPSGGDCRYHVAMGHRPARRRYCHATSTALNSLPVQWTWRATPPPRSSSRPVERALECYRFRIDRLGRMPVAFGRASLEAINLRWAACDMHLEGRLLKL
jgi:hypothetical protein